MRVRSLAQLSPLEAAMLRGSVRPIVLVSRRAQAPIAAAVAPGLRELALMLPYSPLHHLLLDDFGAPWWQRPPIRAASRC